MVTAKQRKEIKRRMKEINDLKNAGAPKRKIEEKAQELNMYLHREGIINTSDD